MIWSWKIFQKFYASRNLNLDQAKFLKILKEYVIKAYVPFLLGLDSTRDWKVLMDMESENMVFRGQMHRNVRGHLFVPLENP